MNIDLMFSSKDMTWGTPQWLFDKLNNAFNFTLDVCALPETAKCKNFYTPETNALIQKWKGVCWMNPPYGREIPIWVQKAYLESRNGATVVCLIPARVDTKYFQDIIFLYTKAVCFIKGRLKFEGKVSIKEYYNDWNDLDDFNQPKKKYNIVMKESNNSAPFPSAIIVFSNYDINNEQYKILNGLGKTYLS